MLSVGIDFGTSNSSIAAFDGRQVSLLPIDGAATDPRIMRSLLYFRRDGSFLAGQDALESYRSENTGREVRLERVWIGEVELTYAEVGTFIKDVFALVDANSPGRLFQSLKRFLPDTSFAATDVFGRRYTLEELLAALARRMLAAAEKALGTKVESAVVGRPVRFSTDADKDEIARKRLAGAWRLAGLEQVEFVEEPVGAIHHFAQTSRLGSRPIAVVFDFGGGTLDISVARVDGPEVEILASAGIALGGDLLDSRVVETRLADLFGARARFRRTGLPLPSYLFGALKSWQGLLELNKAESLKLIRQAIRESDQPESLRAFESLITRNYGFELFQAVEAAKVLLSSREEAMMEVDLEGLRLKERLTRGEFEMVIQPQLAQARGCILTALSDADIDPGDVSLVVTTGGSSLIPAFRRMLRGLLPRADLQESDTFTSVAAGLAILCETRLMRR